MTNENRTMFIASIIGAGVTSTAIMFVYGRLQYKKARRIRFENELSWMQSVSDALKDGKLANLPPDVTDKLQNVLAPLREEGLIK